MPRILFLGDVNSSHTQKWAVALSESGFQIGIFSLSKVRTDWFSESGILVFEAFSSGNKFFPSASFKKVSYLRSIGKLNQAISSFKPDILHAHYATSYGLLGVLSGFKPLLISVWGSDVFEFPRKSYFHRTLVRNNLRSAERIYSSSKVMSGEAEKISGKPAIIIPFGVDMKTFNPAEEKKSGENDVTIGTIKALEKIYGIDTLIKAFRIVVDHNPRLNLKLLIVGGGTQLFALQKLAEKLALTDRVVFKGRIDYKDIPHYYSQMDIFANLSRHESFGVSVLEAMACGKPVIVSSVGGLPELVSDGETGLIVKPEDELSAANAIQRLLDNKQLAITLGLNAREQVRRNFDWNNSVEMMIQQYNEVLPHKLVVK